VFRVYYDRLTDDADRKWLYEHSRTVLKEKLNENMDQLFMHLDFDGDGKVSNIILF
jgi:dynein heavy chain